MRKSLVSPIRCFSTFILQVILPDIVEKISPEEPEVYAAEQNVIRKAANTTRPMATI
jgi:hypothetical protein